MNDERQSRSPAWTRVEQYRFEDRISKEIHELRGDVQKLAAKFAWILGGLGVLVFVVNIGVTIYLRSQ